MQRPGPRSGRRRFRRRDRRRGRRFFRGGFFLAARRRLVGGGGGSSGFEPLRGIVLVVVLLRVPARVLGGRVLVLVAGRHAGRERLEGRQLRRGGNRRGLRAWRARRVGFLDGGGGGSRRRRRRRGGGGHLLRERLLLPVPQPVPLLHDFSPADHHELLALAGLDQPRRRAGGEERVLSDPRLSFSAHLLQVAPRQIRGRHARERLRLELSREHARAEGRVFRVLQVEQQRARLVVVLLDVFAEERKRRALDAVGGARRVKLAVLFPRLSTQLSCRHEHGILDFLREHPPGLVARTRARAGRSLGGGGFFGGGCGCFFLRARIARRVVIRRDLRRRRRFVARFPLLFARRGGLPDHPPLERPRHLHVEHRLVQVYVLLLLGVHVKELRGPVLDIYLDHFRVVPPARVRPQHLDELALEVLVELRDGNQLAFGFLRVRREGRVRRAGARRATRRSAPEITIATCPTDSREVTKRHARVARGGGGGGGGTSLDMSAGTYHHGARVASTRSARAPRTRTSRGA